MQKWLVLLLLACSWAPLARGAGDENFPRPDAVENRVRFWTRVYTEVGTSGGLLHDAQHLDIVYETIHFPKNASWRAQKRQVKRAKAHIAGILRRLAGGQRTGLSAEEKRILALWPPGVSNRTLSLAARRVRFQLGQADKFRAGIQRASAWEPHIREVIADQQVPAELAALPHVESSYDPRAVSKVGAAGLWQFTRSTGRRFLRVDHVVDERFDPFRSSEAAAQLLRQNYEMTGSWPLAITAYNHGANGVRRAMRKLGTRDIGRIVENYRSRTFGFASRNFYSEFLAALHVELHAERYFGEIETAVPEDHEVIRLEDYVPARALASAFDVDLRTLQLLNPALRPPVWKGQKLVPRGFELRLPAVPERPAATTLLASLPDSARFARQRPDVAYRVRRGDTLSTIARRYGVRVSDIVALNGLRSRHRIRVGQRLRLPQVGQPQPVVVAKASHRPRPQPVVRALSEDGTYTVQRGDTLTDIARDLGVTTEDLVLANGLDRPNHLAVGQVIRVASVRADEASEERSPSAEEATQRTAAWFGPPPPEPLERSGSELDPEPLERPGAELELPLDPARYAVSGSGWLRVQPEETLGHYAHWLEIPTQRLRRLNGLRYGDPLVIGQRVRLDFGRVVRGEFEARRLAHHRALRERFFEEHRIAGTEEHVLRRGETLWELSRRRYRVPVWLLSDFNQDVDLAALRAGVRLTIPQLRPREDPATSSQRTRRSRPNAPYSA